MIKKTSKLHNDQYEISHFFLFKHSISFIHRKLNSMQLSSINVIYGD